MEIFSSTKRLNVQCQEKKMQIYEKKIYNCINKQKKGHFELNSNFESDQFSNGQNCQIRAYKIGLKVGPKWFYNLP